MLNFQRPLSFFLLLLLPTFVLLRRTGRLQAVSISLPLGNWNGFVPEKNLRVYLAHRISQYVLAAAFVFAVAALAEPVRQTSEAMYAGSGQALMFVIDTSPSMAAQDMGTQTRLEAAKQIIKSFAEKYEGDSLGLTALGSSAAVLIPPTIDRHTFLTRLDQLQVGEFGDGTAIGMGLASAVLHLTQYSAIPSHIILFTDGDNNTGEVHPRAAADIIKHKKIGFYIIGLGKSGYAPVKYIDPIQKKEISGTLKEAIRQKSRSATIQSRRRQRLGLRNTARGGCRFGLGALRCRCGISGRRLGERLRTRNDGAAGACECTQSRTRREGKKMAA